MPKPPIRKPQSLDIQKVIKQALRFHQQGKLKDAERLYQAVLKLRPNHFDALRLVGVLRGQEGRHEAAIKLISLALEQDPRSAEAHANLGISLAKLNRLEEAIASADKALAIKPDHADALTNRGNALQALDRHEEAVASFDKALAIKPNHADALSNRGIAQARLNRHGEAIASFDKALAINPIHANALSNRGIVLTRLNRHEEAIASFDRALIVKPDHADALSNRGNALHALGRYEEAIGSYEKALAVKPDHADALNSHGNALTALRRYKEAIGSYEKALAINPDHRYASGHTAYCRAHVCDWENRDLIEQRLVDKVQSGKRASVPFMFLAFSHSPADQLACATTFVKDTFPAIRPPPVKGPRYQHDRIRLAYLSANFHDHANAYLIAGLLEQHDRSQFETIGISFGPDTQSEMRSRLVNGLERFIDVRADSDEAVARVLRDLEVDIAVDLRGFTRDARTGILARRPAPIQVNYLGFPGTMGADYIDYVIADEFVIPRDHQNHYVEKVVYLPECYQANDSKRKISERTPTRAEVGLPEQVFVFCCFNNNYKLTPQIFDIWMRLLQRVEHSVLWLYQRNAETIANLRREAQARGVASDRLVFASKVKLEDHLARHRLGDVFLDTLPYNAHTTASDALWAGLPVVTCAGRTFAGRVAGSLLHAAGLPELVTYTLEDYESLALKLATDEVLLREIKEKLARERLTKPLFDTDRFRRHIEAAYTTMWEIHQRGEEPRSFKVPAVD